MTERPFRLPPLNALRVFHTVVRHRSFRSAADELRVTPQAVSQQIKLLEDTLGLELFERKGRAIEPNEHAILLAHFIQAGFEEFAEGVRRVSKTGQRNRTRCHYCINQELTPCHAFSFVGHDVSLLPPQADPRAMLLRIARLLFCQQQD